MTPAQKAALTVASAVLIACGIAANDIAEEEGWVSKGYLDVIGVKTRCLGNTGPGIVVGKAYSPDECIDLYMKDLVKHGMATARCLPALLPRETRAAFISVGLNIGGAGAFCSSAMSRKALAGDLKGACAAISLYQFAGKLPNGEPRDCRIRYNDGHDCPGIPPRRARERARCEAGLAELPR